MYGEQSNSSATKRENHIVLLFSAIKFASSFSTGIIESNTEFNNLVKHKLSVVVSVGIASPQFDYYYELHYKVPLLLITTSKYIYSLHFHLLITFLQCLVTSVPRVLPIKISTFICFAIFCCVIFIVNSSVWYVLRFKCYFCMYDIRIYLQLKKAHKTLLHLTGDTMTPNSRECLLTLFPVRIIIFSIFLYVFQRREIKIVYPSNCNAPNISVSAKRWRKENGWHGR